jgi:hypothetical protein
MRENDTARGTIEVPPGEDQGIDARFTAAEVAAAFGVETVRVERAIAGEFGPTAGTTIDSRRAQELAEVILGDEPLDHRQAALMRLGAFAPRRDADWGLGDARRGEESDLQAARADVAPTDLASPRSSHDPATQPVE